jgi:hypothetical protein
LGLPDYFDFDSNIYLGNNMLALTTGVNSLFVSDKGYYFGNEAFITNFNPTITYNKQGRHPPSDIMFLKTNGTTLDDGTNVSYTNIKGLTIDESGFCLINRQDDEENNRYNRMRYYINADGFEYSSCYKGSSENSELETSMVFRGQAYSNNSTIFKITKSGIPIISCLTKKREEEIWS